MATFLALLPTKLVALLPDFLVLPEPQAQQVILCNIGHQLLVRENKWLGNSIDDLGLFRVPVSRNTLSI